VTSPVRQTIQTKEFWVATREGYTTGLGTPTPGYFEHRRYRQAVQVLQGSYRTSLPPAGTLATNSIGTTTLICGWTTTQVLDSQQALASHLTQQPCGEHAGGHAWIVAVLERYKKRIGDATLTKMPAPLRPNRRAALTHWRTRYGLVGGGTPPPAPPGAMEQPAASKNGSLVA